ncbi:MAG: hypothetical protein WEB89_06475 [Balneolales bacterium]
MITLHRKENDPDSDELEEKLNDLVLAFEAINHSSGDGGPLPYIEEGEKKVQGEKEIEEWLIGLQDELGWQRSLSGDACYIDPKTGKVC